MKKHTKKTSQKILKKLGAKIVEENSIPKSILSSQSIGYKKAKEKNPGKTYILTIEVTPATEFQDTLISGMLSAYKSAALVSIKDFHKKNKVVASIEELLSEENQFPKKI